MKMTYTHVTIIAYFITATLNWLVLWIKDKHLLNSSYERLENKFCLKWI